MDKPKSVKTTEEIKDNIERFNREIETLQKEANPNIEDIKINNIKYWVYDTEKSQFAPCKFVQCIGMTLLLYKRWRRIQKAKGNFGSFEGGGKARKRVTKITKKQFKENANLRNKLENWAKHKLGVQLDAFYKSGKDKGKNKWKFIALD